MCKGTSYFLIAQNFQKVFRKFAPKSSIKLNDYPQSYLYLGEIPVPQGQNVHNRR
jgi:hypothetical protein